MADSSEKKEEGGDKLPVSFKFMPKETIAKDPGREENERILNATKATDIAYIKHLYGLAANGFPIDVKMPGCQTTKAKIRKS